MSDVDRNPVQYEVEQLHRLAMDAHHEGHYATMERLLEQAVSMAELLGDLPLLVKERCWLAAILIMRPGIASSAIASSQRRYFCHGEERLLATKPSDFVKMRIAGWLATAQRMPSMDRAAMTTYTWPIGLATDPSQSRRVADEDSLWYLAGACMYFVECGRLLPAMPTAQLFRVVADGLAWCERIGKQEWTAGLRLQRGLLLATQGDFSGARQEMEAALALKRRHHRAPGYTLADRQLARRRLPGARQLLRRAQPLAEQLDRAAGRDSYQKYLDTLLKQAEALAALLEQQLTPSTERY